MVTQIQDTLAEDPPSIHLHSGTSSPQAPELVVQLPLDQPILLACIPFRENIVKFLISG